MRNRISVLGIGLAVSALAAVSSAGGMAAASRVAPPAVKVPPAVKKVTLTLASDGSTVLATKGELVVVKLSGGRLRWSPAQAVQSTPVLALMSEGTSTSGGSTTVFRVVNYGSAELDATGTPVCTSATGCPQYVVLWHATIVVPVVDPPPPVAAG
jgi:hypothetical protein